jgi:hypothetical protein
VGCGLGGEPRVDVARGGDPNRFGWQFMVAKSVEARKGARASAKSPPRGGASAMRGGLTALIPRWWFSSILDS